MLRELHISNLAVIEDVTVELGEGLNCFTGQTGAGKSLILTSFEVLLGLKPSAAADMLRPGAEEARITGVFELHGGGLAKQVGELLDQTLEPGEPLLVTRKFFASGRSSLSVNGQPATSAMVRALGEALVDIHGQHDHQFLLKPSNQVVILDSFGRCEELRHEFAGLHAKLRAGVRRREELSASRALRKQQLDLYEFQAQEIDAAEPREGEYDELRARHALLSNLEKVRREAGQAFNALYEAEGSIVERLQMVVHVLTGLAEIDPSLGEVSEQIRTCALTLQESAFELNRYTDKMDLDPREIAEVDDRLNTLNRLISKYATGAGQGEDTCAAVLAYRAQIAGEIEQLRGQNEDLDQLEGEIKQTRAAMLAVGAKLSEARRAAAKRLRPLVEAELKQLGMSEAEFEVGFEKVSASGGGAENEDAVGAAGLESIEMLVRTNPGQPARPLRRIASGGELSRVMLAVKSILAQSDRISVLVFDEIDANIGGRMGTVIGQKLRALAGGPKPGKKGGGAASGSSSGGGAGRHQVVCITHLPQIAAFADRHLRIAKAVEGKGKARQTSITVTALEGPARVEELAEMLAGKDVTETTRKQVREMLAAAGG